jgi:SAM-dependent methyltransferase
MRELILDESFITAQQLISQSHAKRFTILEALHFLVSPDSGKSLVYSKDKNVLSDGAIDYPVIDNIPILYPSCINKAYLEGGMDLKYYSDPKLQYFLLSQIKQRGEINAMPDNLHYQRHLFRMKDFVKNCSGIVLDIGCDNVEISAALFNEKCSYIGLDPFSGSKSNFRIVGVGECLPFCDESIDNVIFNTSLDHILDYHLALDEARRVLKPGGSIYLSTLIWLNNASLLNDNVHFHHFREFEIMGVFDGMLIEKALRYQYKDDRHRYGLYLSAKKQ